MKKNILIIEDDEFFRELISKNLISAGYEVAEAIDGKMGTEKAKASKPDLILLDLLLPNIDGFETLAMLKKDSATSSIPVLILSNLDTKEDIERGLKLGAMDFLIKSQFSSDDILAKIKSAIK